MTDLAVDFSALYREDATFEAFVAAHQSLIDSGAAWRLEGSVGRAAMDLIEQGYCTLGEEGHRDYWGNYVPSRHEVAAGSKGSASYVEAKAALREVED
jgi:hypothetical protein